MEKFTRKRAKEEFGIQDFSTAPKRVRLTREWVHAQAVAEHGSVGAAVAKVHHDWIESEEHSEDLKYILSRVKTVQSLNDAFDREISVVVDLCPLTFRMVQLDGSTIPKEELVELASIRRNSIFTDDVNTQLMQHFGRGGPSPAPAIIAAYVAREQRAARVAEMLSLTGLRPAMQPEAMGGMATGDVLVRLIVSRPARFLELEDAMFPPSVNMHAMLVELSAHVNHAGPLRPLADSSAVGAAPDMVPWLQTWSKEAHSAACSAAHQERVRTALLVLHRALLPTEIALMIVKKTAEI